MDKPECKIGRRKVSPDYLVELFLEIHKEKRVIDSSKLRPVRLEKVYVKGTMGDDEIYIPADRTRKVLREDILENVLTGEEMDILRRLKPEGLKKVAARKTWQPSQMFRRDSGCKCSCMGVVDGFLLPEGDTSPAPLSAETPLIEVYFPMFSKIDYYKSPHVTRTGTAFVKRDFNNLQDPRMPYKEAVDFFVRDCARLVGFQYETRNRRLSLVRKMPSGLSKTTGLEIRGFEADETTKIKESAQKFYEFYQEIIRIK